MDVLKNYGVLDACPCGGQGAWDLPCVPEVACLYAPPWSAVLEVPGSGLQFPHMEGAEGVPRGGRDSPLPLCVFPCVHQGGGGSSAGSCSQEGGQGAREPNADIPAGAPAPRRMGSCPGQLPETHSWVSTQRH